MNPAGRPIRPIYALHAALVGALLALTACGGSAPEEMVGTLERDRIEIKVESDEPVTALHVRDGQAVHAGALLFSQDPARADARLGQARAERAQAAARLAELKRGPRQEAIDETRARLSAAGAQTVNAKAQLERTREVFARGLSSQAVLDLADAQWKSAAAEEQAIRETLASQLSGTTIEELDQAEAALAAADARLSQAQLERDRADSYAPVAGIIDKVLFQLGERPPAGATVAVLLDSSRVFARFYVPEPLRTRVVPGAELTVRIDGTESELRGTVRWVSADASFTPYFALTEHDRSRLSYLAELDLPAAADLPSGTPLVVLQASP